MRFGSVFRRAVHFAPFDIAWGKRADWCFICGAGGLGSEQDVAAEAHGPDVFSVNAPHAIETARAAAGLGVPCRPVLLDHGVKEKLNSDGVS